MHHNRWTMHPHSSFPVTPDRLDIYVRLSNINTSRGELTSNREARSASSVVSDSSHLLFTALSRYSRSGAILYIIIQAKV